jgi:integrase/recombinase XerD
MKSLHKAVQEYLQLRIRMGFKLTSAKGVLKSFVSFMKEKKASYITTNLALEFATKNPNSSSNRWSVILGIIRQFALYWCALDHRTQIPPSNILPHSYHRKSPYIYSESDIIKLLKCCKNIFPKHELRPHTYFTLFGLLAVTGIRISEALTLRHESIDLKNGIITILHSKLQKSRHVPLDRSTTKILQQYAKHRDQCFSSSKTSFFL